MKINVVATVLFVVSLVSCGPAIIVTPTHVARDTPMPTRTKTAEPSALIAIDYPKGVGSSISAGNTISIANIGSLAAENLTVWICTSQINDNWQILEDISSFLVVPENQGFDFTQEYEQSDICSVHDKSAFNVVVLKFTSLAPNQSIEVNVKLGTNIQTIEQTYNGTVHIKYASNIPVPTGQDEIHFASMLSVMTRDRMMETLTSESLISNFLVKTACDNCLPEEKLFHYYGAAKRFAGGCEKQDKSPMFFRITCRIIFEYYIPDQSPKLPIADDDIYLLTVWENGNYSFTEIDKTEFDANSP